MARQHLLSSQRDPTLGKLSLRFAELQNVGCSRGYPYPLSDLGSGLQMTFQMLLGGFLLLDYHRHFTGVRAVWLQGYDRIRGCVTQQVVPAVVVGMRFPHRCIKVKTVGELAPKPSFDPVLINTRQAAESRLHQRQQKRATFQRLPDRRTRSRCHSLSRFRCHSTSSGASSDSLTASRTASEKCDEYVVNPPQPDTRSSSSNGSSVEMSCECTLPSGSNSREYTR